MQWPTSFREAIPSHQPRRGRVQPSQHNTDKNAAMWSALFFDFIKKTQRFGVSNALLSYSFQIQKMDSSGTPNAGAQTEQKYY